MRPAGHRCGVRWQSESGDTDLGGAERGVFPGAPTKSAVAAAALPAQSKE
jgi:hypothetical protein